MTVLLDMHLQSLEVGHVVELFTLDLSPLQVDTQFYFTSTNLAGTEIVFGGQTYTYAGIDLTGAGMSADGTPSNPKVFIPNIGKLASSLVIQHGDLVGAKLTRVRTFKQFLDGQEDADPGAIVSRDVFKIEQKRNLNQVYGEFTLRPIHNLEGKKIPGELCFKTVCTARYRAVDTATDTFVYDRATCPYVGAALYDKDGNPVTDKQDDVCSHNLTGCKRRFGESAVLPIHAYPGMLRRG